MRNFTSLIGSFSGVRFAMSVLVGAGVRCVQILSLIAPPGGFREGQLWVTCIAIGLWGIIHGYIILILCHPRILPVTSRNFYRSVSSSRKIRKLTLHSICKNLSQRIRVQKSFTFVILALSTLSCVSVFPRFKSFGSLYHKITKQNWQCSY